MNRVHGTNRPGFFLSLDGPDGGGKTTQARLLAEWLRAQGLPVLECRDPGGTALGDRVRGLLLDHGDSTPISGRAEMLLFMASRAQLVEERIEPALAAGQVVISDRFLLATTVYQGHASGLDADEIWRIGLAATAGLLPDLTLVLDIPPEQAAARLSGPRDRMEARGTEFQKRVRSGFLRALKTYPVPFRLIDASVEVDRVTQKIQNEVAHALGIGSRP